MDSNTSILNPTIQLEKSDEYTPSIVTDINSSLTHNKSRNEQDKRVRKELDTQILDDLYEPIHKTFTHNSKFLTSKDGDILSGDKGIIMTGIWNCNYNGIC
ncbi:8774_t:CDS:2 [Dentiscutata erythropus]|uniref:8774_t:CDS:1 n=1 Tax=Dentiscutata erythropus TaxID=1348616 RepID=A0A9N9JSR7_9GLOM|nr:8774_t:CDS:2 [Dentiscutata erythropus]